MRLLSSWSFVLVGLAVGCGGTADNRGVDDDSMPGPTLPTAPPVQTRFDLRIDGKPVDLEPPTGTKFVSVDTDGLSMSNIAVQASAPTRGDAINSVGVNLSEPFRPSTIDCTPDAHGAVSTGGAIGFGNFFGFTPTITDCSLEVTYVSNERVVGRFSANAHAPAQSSLAGKVARVEGEFDVPVVTQEL